MVKTVTPPARPQNPQRALIDLDALRHVEHSDDVVEYTLRCILALSPQMEAEVLRACEQHVRDLFGGEDVWVGKRRDLTLRNQGIVRDYLAGERIGLLSRRYGLSERRILQIIKS